MVRKHCASRTKRIIAQKKSSRKVRRPRGAKDSAVFRERLDDFQPKLPATACSPGSQNRQMVFKTMASFHANLGRFKVRRHTNTWPGCRLIHLPIFPCTRQPAGYQPNCQKPILTTPDVLLDNGYCVSEAGEYGIEGNTSRLLFGKKMILT